MKQCKRLLCLMLALAMVAVMLPVAVPQAQAAGLSLSELQKQFPAGAYWNHRTSAGNNPNGYTWYACDHGKGDRNGDGVYTDCNSYCGGWQCWAFARKVAALAYNDKNVIYWDITYDLDALKAGDIVQFGTSDTGKGHTVWVTRVTDTTVTIADCNCDGTCVIRWNVTLSRSGFNKWYAKSGNVYKFSYIVSAPYALTEPKTLTFHGCGGTVSRQTLTVDAGFAAGVMPVSELEGYHFVGWFTADGSQVASQTAIWSDMDLYARWSYAGHRVTFDTQGGVLPEAAAILEADGEDVTHKTGSLTVYTQAGADLCAKATERKVAVSADGQVTDAETVPEGGFVVCGGEAAALPAPGDWASFHFETGILCVYDSYEAYVAGEKTVSAGEVYGDLPVPERAGMLFCGWYNEQGQRVTWNSPVVLNPVLHAVWTAEDTPVAGTSGAYGGSTYVLYDHPMTWGEAQALCQTLGGQLADPERETEWSFLTELAQAGTAAGYYIGATPTVLNADGAVKTLMEDPVITECYGFICRYDTAEEEHTHRYDGYFVSLNPTEARAGILVEFCVCGDRVERTLPRITEAAYTLVNGTDATCEEGGSKEYEFLGFEDGGWAGLTLTVYERALGHNEELTGSRLPTAGKDGYYKWTCSRCGESRIQVLPAGVDLEPFPDVEAARFYYWPVTWAVEWGITSGVDEHHFAPADVCTRAQVVTFLWRAMGSPEPEGADCAFEDLNPMAYYDKAVLWAVENGVTSGMDATHFAPDETVTRGQFVTFLWRAAGQPEPEGDNPFEDVQEETFCYASILWAVENGITTGMDAGHFAPSDSCTRGQVVTFLYRYFGCP